MKRTISIMAGLIFFYVTLGVNLAQGASGALDPSFGQGGQVLSSYGSSVLIGGAALQTDGKIIVLFSINESSFAVTRYLPGGALDTGFGSGGFVQTAFTNFLNVPTSIALQSDGKIVVAGAATSNQIQYELALARFDASGNLDNSFGVGGQVTTGLPGLLSGAAIVIQSDNRILVAASALLSPRSSPQIAMARYNSDGSLDTAFGQNGTLEQAATINNPTNVGLHLAIDSAGNILVGFGASIIRFTPGGQITAQVSPALVVNNSLGGPAIFQADGKYLLAKLVLEGSVRSRDEDTQVLRFTSNGNVDASFNSPIFDFSGEGGNSQGDITNAIAIQPNGQIVLGASHFDSGFSNELFALGRLDQNGSLDSTFGNGGRVTTSVGGVEGVAAVLIQSDGKIVAIGTANNFSSVALVRYLGQ
jgi:uncharacterized delta-60 repeat protein